MRDRRDERTDHGAGGESVTSLRDDRRGALISDDGVYRYRLHRTWDSAKPTVAFLMLNPSTADATEDDPTIRRCIGFAKEWGYGTLIVGNLFALRSTDPERLTEHPEPVGPENDAHLMSICGAADQTIAAWGTRGSFGSRGYEVVEMLDVAFTHSIRHKTAIQIIRSINRRMPNGRDSHMVSEPTTGASSGIGTERGPHR